MLRILIADDHNVVRRGLEQILAEEFRSAYIDHATDGEELLKKVLKQEWDIVISDISMPGRSGLDVLQQIKQHYPKLPVLILSVHPEDQYALRVLKAGASGYLNKDSAPDELVKAVHQALIGRRYITTAIAERLASMLDEGVEKLPHEMLSDREFEVLKLLAAGHAVFEIAEKLSLSATTVSTYRARVMTKMNCRTNADLTLYAINQKLI